MKKSWLLSVNNPSEGIAQFFEKILNFYCKPGQIVVDTTCGEMLMWSSEAKDKYKPITIDIRKEVSPTFVGRYSEILGHEIIKADVVIFDPPYIALSGKINDSYGAEKYQYGLGPTTYDEFVKWYKLADESFYRVGAEMVIVKATDFHLRGQFISIVDITNCFSHYDLWDILVYRFFKPIPNLNWYKCRVPKTHSYFLIFRSKHGSRK